MNYKEKIEFERQKIADRILERIQDNNLEWSAGWHRFSQNPQNAKTGQRYKGTNMVILFFEGLEKGYEDPRWLTFNQAKELGAQVKAGEKATTIFHWNEYDKSTKTVPNWKEINKLPFEEKLQYCKDNIRYSVSYHNVFNAEQCNGLEKFVAPTLSAAELAKQNEKIERVITASAAPVLYDGGNRAYYNFEEDKIHLPKIESFKTKDDYYATALHEIAHSTGHESRLNRNLSAGTFGDKTYAIEELRAEFASLFMQSELDVNIDAKHFDNHSAYIQNWAEAIREDKNVLFAAIKDAGDIATYVRENYAESKKEDIKKNEGEKIMDDYFDDYETEASVVEEHMQQAIIREKERKAEEKKTQEKNKIDPLKVEYATEKAVLVKLAIAGQDGLKETWFPKSQIELDEKGENVVAVNSYLQAKYGNILSKQAAIKATAVGKSVSEKRPEVKEPTASGKELAQKINAQRLANLEKNVPAEMKALPNWCVLKIYKDKASGAYKKFIVNANEPAGGWANHKDPATWTTFDKALEYAKANGGAGLSFAIKGSGYTAFDIDHCYNKETKTYNETAKQYLAALPDSYAEKSVSGTGVHIFTKGSLCENGKYNEARGGTADVEVFETWGFVSMTGDLIDDHHKSLVEMEDNVKRVIQIEVGEKKVFQTENQTNRNQYHNYAKSDSEVIEKIRNSRKADDFNSLMSGVDLCGDHSRSDAKLMNILAYFSNSNQAQMQSIFKQSKLYRPEKGDAYVERTAKFAVNSLNQRAQ